MGNCQACSLMLANSYIHTGTTVEAVLGTLQKITSHAAHDQF